MALKHKHILWGTLLFGLTVVSPLPALAQSPNQPPPASTSHAAHTQPPDTGNAPQNKISAPCSVPCGEPPPLTSRNYSFQEVWALIIKHQRARASHFTPELVACLMWEESGFRLAENPKSHALGFGQLLPSTLGAVNKRYNTRFTRTQVLSVPEASVEATVLALELAWSWKKNKLDALTAYAGGTRNYKAVRRWIAAEPVMIQAGMPAVEDQLILIESQGSLIRGLQICSQPGFDPRKLFD